MKFELSYINTCIRNCTGNQCVAMEEEQEFITIDETDCDTTEYELYSSKNSSKRKAEESEPELLVSPHPSKKKRQHSRSSKTSCEVPFISVQFVSQAVAR